jgi:signal transduction histidine kinase
MGNEHQLQQVFTNLMVNAQQAMPEGGKLTISTAQKNGFVEINFADTGNGIPKEHLDKVFDPFFTTKAPGEGTGLGLSVTYGIIRDMGGKITVESQVGKGTNFCVKLPPKTANKEKGTTSTKERSHHG